MDFLAIFCYITATCDVPAAPAASVAPAAAVPLSVTPATPAVSSGIRAPNANQNPRPGNDGRKTVRETEVITYPTRYDYIDVEAVMGNDRIIKVLFNCVMSRGPCTREGLELKRVIPDAIQTECSKCSDRQKKQAGKALAHLLTYKPEYWKMLVQRFDPNNVHLKKYMTDDNEDNTTPQNQINGTVTNRT